MTTETNTLIESCKQAVTLNLLQSGSRLAYCVRMEKQSVDKHTYTSLLNGKVAKRAVSLITYDWQYSIDNEKDLIDLGNPTSHYALDTAWGLGRKIDVSVVKALLGTSLEGESGDDVVNLRINTISANYSEDNNTAEKGLTVAKLRKAKEILDSAIAGKEDRFCLVTIRHLSDLLKATDVNTKDYSSIKSLIHGKTDTFMGFTFKMVSSLLLPKKSVICFARSAVLLAINPDIKTDIETGINVTCIYAGLACGATRMNGNKVVEILCKKE